MTLEVLIMRDTAASDEPDKPDEHLDREVLLLVVGVNKA